MIIETQRMVTDWLNDPTHGLNAKLTGLPTGSGDSSPTPLALIANEVDNNDVARERVPSQYPNLSIYMPANNTVDANILTSYRGGTVGLGFRYAVRATDTKLAARNSYYVQRALLQSLGGFLDNANVASRTRNNIQVIGVSQDIQHGNFHQKIDDALVLSEILVTFDVRDETP